MADSNSDRGAKRSRKDMEENNPQTAANEADGTRPRLFLCMDLKDTNNSPDSSSGDDFGPALPSAQPAKKRRKLPYESLYVAALPSSPRYSRSLMHRDALVSTTFTPFTDFLITTSVDGVVKFWKKTSGAVEFVKEFKAHTDEIVASSVSADGRSFASAGKDGKIMIFDVATFGTLPEVLQ